MSSASTRRITRPKGPFASPCSCARAASAATAPRAAASSSGSSLRVRRCARRSATSTDSSRTRVRLHFMALRFRRFYPTSCELACGPLSPRERLPVRYRDATLRRVLTGQRDDCRYLLRRELWRCAAPVIVHEDPDDELLEI